MQRSRLSFFTFAMGFFFLAIAAGLHAQTPDQQEIQALVDKGVQAFRAARFGEAREFFARCVGLDPYHIVSRLYLGSVYAVEYIPGAPSEENKQFGEKAMEQFREVLKLDPVNLSAIDALGALLFQMAGSPYDPQKLQESLELHKRHIELAPDDPEPHYWVGVIQWTRTYRANMELRERYNEGLPTPAIRDNDPLLESLRRDFADRYGPIADEGAAALRRAMELRNDYEDAMAYLNLLYRQEADMAETPQERDHFLRLADELIEKVKILKKKKLGMRP